MRVWTSLCLAVVYFVALHQVAVDDLCFTLPCNFMGHQRSLHVEQAESRHVAAFQPTRIKDALTEHLQPAAYSQHRDTLLCSAREFRRQSGLPQITQTLDGILAARQDNGVVTIQALDISNR